VGTGLWSKQVRAAVDFPLLEKQNQTVLRGSRSSLVQRGVNLRKCLTSPYTEIRRRIDSGSLWLRIRQNKETAPFLLQLQGQRGSRCRPPTNMSPYFVLSLTTSCSSRSQPSVLPHPMLYFPSARSTLMEWWDFARASVKGTHSSSTESALNTGKSPQNPILSDGSEITAHRQCSISHLAPR